MRSRQITLLLAALCSGLVGVGTAAAAGIGVNDDSAKYADDGGAWFFSEARKVGLRQVVISNRFRPTDPDRIQEEAQLDRALADAAREGIEVVLAVYPYPPREFELGGVDLPAFGRYLDRLARRVPAGAPVRDRERAEPARVLAAALPADGGHRFGGTCRRPAGAGPTTR